MNSTADMKKMIESGMTRGAILKKLKTKVYIPHLIKRYSVRNTMILSSLALECRAKK